ncbi:hypothetical protein SynBIOSE41_02450 [Synechococcus sp. BIOS-E4-1]|jgi:hypothetical protein|uniref:hypothetical protein n=1 Tax=unclassified Synechococcus TaxID=2626047 RepID=UPI0000E535C9|nr:MULTISPECIES: hypothetical protein [unclassified Synechococcus]EAU74604.1 hypothetical protein RS9916_33892 [Synechococcus sp. RS9916]EAU74607.1 hypothetical protein RS9916_33907 [Synechococcus sp. RS9916]QNI54949.1 hypothetical protein SynBIOSE41_02450 [Synechococcus sp. BIOS-E4-1]
MTNNNQSAELTNDQLEAIQGGKTVGTWVDVGMNFIPVIGQMNTIASLWGGSTGQNIDNINSYKS